MNKTLGRPICFFTELEYGNFNDVPDYDSDTLGEENAEIHYVYKELKSGKEERGKAFYNMPYHPVSIHAVKDALNVEEYGEGDYGIDSTVSYDECAKALEDILREGKDIEEITSTTIKNKINGISKVK